MASLLALLFTTVFVVTVFGDLEYYQDLGSPSDDLAIQELKELFKSGEFLPYDTKDVEYEGGPGAPHYGGPPPGSEVVSPFDERSPPVPVRDYKRHLSSKSKQYELGYEIPSEVQGYSDEPEFYYNMRPMDGPETKTPFAVPPVDPRYYQQVLSTTTDKADLKRAVTDNVADRFENVPRDVNYYDDRSSGDAEDLQYYENAFEEPRQHRQNPNLAATKVNKIIYPPESAPDSNSLRGNNPTRFGMDRNIPTSLIPIHRQHYVIQQALKNNAGYNSDSKVYIYAIIAGVGAAAAVAIIAFIIGWYTMRKNSKAAVDVEYPAYGVTGPNTDVTPSGDRQLAHSAQMYHYQHQKQQIIAMESRGGVAERNGSVSDAESEDENDEGDYTVYECPGFATTGEMEVKNPLFLDEPTPATPAQQPPQVSSNNSKKQ